MDNSTIALEIRKMSKNIIVDQLKYIKNASFSHMRDFTAKERLAKKRAYKEKKYAEKALFCLNKLFRGTYHF